ncbi:MAG: AroM family protein [Pseudothermotoga sp.]
MLFITIGESPRDDVVPELVKIIGKKDLHYTEIGLIDGVDPDEYKPEVGEELLVSRKRDGTVAHISHRWVAEKLSKMDFGDLAVLLCTAKFQDDRLILPYKVIDSFFKAMPRMHRATVVVPEEEQCKDALKRWGKIAQTVKCIYFSPYEKETIDENFIELKDQQLVYLDCVGFTLQHERYFKKYTDGIVLSARKILGNYLRTFL